MRFAVVPAPFVEKAAFPQKIYWHSCRKVIDHTFKYLFPNSHLYSTDICFQPYDSNTVLQ